MKVYMMKPEEINEAPFNPALRTESDYIAELLADIEENGIETPLLVGKDGILGDGHRRLACARLLGLSEVPVIKSKHRTAAEIYVTNWGRISKSTRGAEWLQAVTQGFPVALVPGNYKANIETMQRVHPEDELKEIASNGQSPYIVGFAKFVARHVGDTTDAMIRKITLWFIENGVQYKARKAIEEGCSPDVVLQAINENRPIMVIYK